MTTSRAVRIGGIGRTLVLVGDLTVGRVRDGLFEPRQGFSDAPLSVEDLRAIADLLDPVTAADQPTTEPSEGRDAIVEAVVRGQRRARNYSSQRIASLRGGASEQELTTWRETWPHRPEREFVDEELDRLAPAPQPAADTETEVQWGVRRLDGRIVPRDSKRDAWADIDDWGGTLVSIREEA